MNQMLFELFRNWLYQYYGVESINQLKNVSHRDVIKKFCAQTERKLGEEFCGG